MAITLLDDVTKATLTKAQYKQDRTKVSNNHPAVAAIYDRLVSTANELGVDLALTGYTFTASKSEKYGVTVYGPYVGNVDGVACIIWGEVKKPLSEVPVATSIEEVDKRCVIEFDMEEEALQLPLMQPKENKATKEVLKKALRKGELANYLSVSFDKPKSLSTLEPGTYLVTEVKTAVFSGEVKYSIYVPGQGWFNANKAIKNKVVNNPVVTQEFPAEMEVFESTSTTSTGYPIVPVRFTTHAETQLTVFSFD